MSCIALDNATVVSLPVRNNNSLVSKNATVADGFCAIIADYLPSDCTCTDARVGGTVDCSADVVVDDIGVRAEFRPCDSPAYISLTVYESKIGFSYNVGKIAAGSSIDEPIPGLDVGIPILGDCGVYADASVSGNLNRLSVSLGLNVCGEILGRKVCGSDLYSGLPVQLLSGTWDFSSLCNAPVTCSCDTPGAGTAGHNRYHCTDGTSGYCSANAECYSKMFNKGDWGNGCRTPQ